MNAVVIKASRLSWEERPAPVAGNGELLVRVAAAGVNGADIAQRAGKYPPPPGVPEDQPGLELAGTVEANGPGTRRFAPGDRVMSLASGAAQAELAVIPEMLAMPVPEQTDLVAAGGFPEVFATAHDALFTQAHLAMGERVLVTGAAGGVGLAAVQLALAAGASVVASARDQSVHSRLAALGAEAATPDGAREMGPYD
ncbi:MAG TPA: alcohol dehydrogenase catalytic domain-containing protein, partial [Acidimicrobiales bacterium]|nr:alcohol dehydrogenase catalytic domain-containing protein [Acidimicrobiales bacterium]